MKLHHQCYILHCSAAWCNASAKIFLSLLSPLFLICSSARKRNCWLALKTVLFFKVLLSFCLLQASQLSYISYVLIKPVKFFNFSLLFSIFSCYLPALYFLSPLWLLPEKHSWILQIFGGIITYLCWRIVHLKNIIHKESLYFNN